MEVIQLNQIQIESVAHVVGKSPYGCFTKLYHDMEGLCSTLHGLPQNSTTFLDFCKDFCMGYDASFNKIATRLTITTMSLVILNNLLLKAGYDQIDVDEDDEDDKGLDFNIL